MPDLFKGWLLHSCRSYDRPSHTVSIVQVDFMMGNLVSNKGTAAVVDGSQVLMTPLQRALIPPPMCAAAAHFAAPVQCCAFGQHEGNEVR